MKNILGTILLSIGLVFNSAHAQNDPPRSPFKIFVAVPAGSGPDKVVREYAEELSALWKTSVLVENRPGGNGVLAANAHFNDKENSIALLPIDNYLSFPHLSKNTAVVDQLFPLSFDGLSELVLFSSPKYETFADLQSAIKQNPTFGSWSIGSPPQIAGMELVTSVGSKSIHAPYVQYGNWFVDVSTQRLTFSFATFGSTKELEKGGKIKYHAVLSNKRNSDYPNLPTLKELTGKDVVGNHTAWVGFFIDRSIPQSRINTIQQDLIKVYNTSNKVKTARSFLSYSTVDDLNAEKVARFMRSEQTRVHQGIDNFKLEIK